MDKDFHTLLNIVVTDWSSLYTQYFMNDIARACNQQHKKNSEWKRSRLEKEERQGYARRKHGVTNHSRFENHFYAEQRSARSRGRGTGWQERYQSSDWGAGGQSSSSNWHGSSSTRHSGWYEQALARVHIHVLVTYSFHNTMLKEQTWSSRVK
eukprot:6188952-Amphidinium_carterae.1